LSNGSPYWRDISAKALWATNNQRIICLSRAKHIETKVTFILIGFEIPLGKLVTYSYIFA